MVNDYDRVISFYHFEYLPTKYLTIPNKMILVNLFDSVILNNRLWRWRIQLQDYDFNIVYRPGQDNHTFQTLFHTKAGTPEFFLKGGGGGGKM